MDDEATHLTPGEVRRIIGRLRGPELLRLSALSRIWATGLRQHDADDLLNEALDRVLSGRRPWPSDVPLPAFLSQVMRSIASQWRRGDRREPLKEDESDAVFDEESHNPTAGYEQDDLILRMRRTLGADPPALGVFDHILADSDREEAQAALGIDATDSLSLGLESKPGLALLVGRNPKIRDEFPLIGGGSDGNFTVEMGVPTLDGLGVDGDGAHTNHEHLLFSSIEPRTRLLQGLMERLEWSPAAGEALRQSKRICKVRVEPGKAR